MLSVRVTMQVDAILFSKYLAVCLLYTVIKKNITIQTTIQAIHPTTLEEAQTLIQLISNTKLQLSHLPHVLGIWPYTNAPRHKI